MKHSPIFSLATAILAIVSSATASETAVPARPIPSHTSPSVVRPSVWMGAGADGTPARFRSDASEIARLTALMESDDETVRYTAAVSWLKETIGPWPHVVALEKAVESRPDGVAGTFFDFAIGILDWSELPADVRDALLRLAIDQAARPEPAPGNTFARADGLLCRFAPDWKASVARREAATASVGDIAVDPTGADARVKALRELQSMNPYERIHRPLDSMREKPTTSLPEIGRDAEDVRISDAAEYLARFSFSDIHGAGESVEAFFLRKNIGHGEGVKVLESVIEDSLSQPGIPTVRETALAALERIDADAAFEQCEKLVRAGTASPNVDRTFVRLAKQSPQRMDRVLRHIQEMENSHDASGVRMRELFSAPPVPPDAPPAAD